MARAAKLLLVFAHGAAALRSGLEVRSLTTPQTRPRRGTTSIASNAGGTGRSSRCNCWRIRRGGFVSGSPLPPAGAAAAVKPLPLRSRKVVGARTAGARATAATAGKRGGRFDTGPGAAAHRRAGWGSGATGWRHQHQHQHQHQQQYSSAGIALRGFGRNREAPLQSPSAGSRLASTAGRNGDASPNGDRGSSDGDDSGSACVEGEAAAAAAERVEALVGAFCAGEAEAGGWQGWVDGMVAMLEEALPGPTVAKKILPLGIMFFFILFDYTILRDTKDVLVVTAPSSGAEVIPFLKTYVNLPGAVVFTVLYSKLCNFAEQERVFYTVLGSFLSFFVVFAAFLYPNRDVLSTAALADSMQAFLPEGLSALSSIVRNWTFSLFYLMSELWGSVVVSVLFWGLANDIVSVSEAKRFYPLFGLGANMALIFSGQYVRLVSAVRQSLPPGADMWGVSLQLLMGAVVAGGIVVAGCYQWIQDNAVMDPECVDASSALGMKETTSLTLKESAAFLGGNAYLRDLAILVVAYGTSINIVEVTWKAKLKVAYPDPNDYSAFMGNFSSTTGLVTLGMMLLGGQVFKSCGWGTAAKATPVVLLVTGAAFFSLSVFGDTAPVQALLGALSISPLNLAVLAGAAQNVLSKSCKYSLFDPCKEMAYIPLSQEEKKKGKAAIDVIGNPLGKSAGSFVQQGFFLATGSLQASTPYLGGVLLAVITSWLVAANSLSKKFEEAMELAGVPVAEKEVVQEARNADADADADAAAVDADADANAKPRTVAVAATAITDAAAAAPRTARPATARSPPLPRVIGVHGEEDLAEKEKAAAAGGGGAGPARGGGGGVGGGSEEAKARGGRGQP